MISDCRKLSVSCSREHAAHLSPKARYVTLADKIANLRTLPKFPRQLAARKTPRGWDLNPRYGYPYNGFRVLRFLVSACVV